MWLYEGECQCHAAGGKISSGGSPTMRLIFFKKMDAPTTCIEGSIRTLLGKITLLVGICEDSICSNHTPPPILIY